MACESSEADEEACKTKGSDGISILEVFSVKYKGIYPVKPEDQTGTICIEANDTLYYLYYETKVDKSKPSIKHGDQLCIDNVGPIYPFRSLDLNFDLFSGKYKGTEEVVACHPMYGNRLEKVSLQSSDSFMRHISVLFGCFPNATVANIKVMLLSPDAAATFSGVVMTTNSEFDHPSCTSYLFSRNPASAIKVRRNGLIPLSKSRVGVPLGSELFVDISLFCDGRYHEGTASFTPKIEESDSCIVDGRILVKVTWNCDEDSGQDSCSTDEDSDFTDEETDFTDEFELYIASEYECDSEEYKKYEILETVP